MNDSARPMSPCFFVGRLVEDREVQRVSVTRLGPASAQLAGTVRCPSAATPSWSSIGRRTASA